MKHNDHFTNIIIKSACPHIFFEAAKSLFSIMKAVVLCHFSNAASQKYFKTKPILSFLHSFSFLISNRNNQIGEQGLDLCNSCSMSLLGIRKIRAKFCVKASVQTEERQDLG